MVLFFAGPLPRLLALPCPPSWLKSETIRSSCAQVPFIVENNSNYHDKQISLSYKTNHRGGREKAQDFPGVKARERPPPTPELSPGCPVTLAGVADVASPKSPGVLLPRQSPEAAGWGQEGVQAAWAASMASSPPLPKPVCSTFTPPLQTRLSTPCQLWLYGQVGERGPSRSPGQHGHAQGTHSRGRAQAKSGLSCPGQQEPAPASPATPVTSALSPVSSGPSVEGGTGVPFCPSLLE